MFISLGFSFFKRTLSRRPVISVGISIDLSSSKNFPKICFGMSEDISFLRSLLFMDFYLPISFCPVVCFAQHLAVFDRSRSALAPSRYMVGVHFAQTPNFTLVGVMTNGAMRAV